MEILVEREQAVRLQFPENAAEFLLNPVHRVKKSASINIHPAAAEFPIRSQQKMKFENLVIEI
jgi:hypothetical protein